MTARRNQYELKRMDSMTHTMNDEEFKEYNEIKIELYVLQQFKEYIEKSAVRFFEKGNMFDEDKPPCKEHGECSRCPIAFLLPDKDNYTCFVGQKTKYSK
jgi:hypothetical protein